MRKPTLHLASAMLVLLAGCAATPHDTAPAIRANAVYHLGAGDGLRIIVYGEDKLTGEYKVSDTGTVTLPLIGPVPANGLSLEEFGALVAATYEKGGLLREPRVAVEVLTYRPFFILGEVNKPGQYPFIPGMTIQQAIATANGYTYRAKQAQVMVTHWGEAKETGYRLDPGAMVSPGDTIRIPERHF